MGKKITSFPKDLKWTVRAFLNDMTLGDSLDVSPVILNPFLKIMEILKISNFNITPRCDMWKSQENPEFLYTITIVSK